MKLTKEMFFYVMGYNYAIQGIRLRQNEVDIAWTAYCALPDDSTDAQVDDAIAKCADDIIACAGSMKE